MENGQRKNNGEQNQFSESIVSQQSDYQKEGFDLLKQFVSEATRQNLHQTVIQDKHQTNQQWANQWNILGTYLFTEATQPELSSVYHMSPERVRQIIKFSTKRLYEASPVALQEKYEFDKFCYKKPFTERNSIHYSRAQGGKLETVFQMARQGKSAQEIRSTISQPIATATRRRGKQLGIEVGYQKPAYSESFRIELEKLEGNELSTEEKRKVLQTINKSYFDGHKDDPDVPFVALSELLAECRFLKKNNQIPIIADVLNASNIATHLIVSTLGRYVMRYGVLAKSDRERAIEVLNTDPQLHQYRSSKITS